MLKLGVKMKWRSPHTRDGECIFNLFCAYQPGCTAGDRRRGGKEGWKAGEIRKKKKRNGAAWTLLQSHDDEAIKVNSSWQTHTINKLTLHKRKHGLSPDNESFRRGCVCLPLSARPSVFR